MAKNRAEGGMQMAEKEQERLQTEKDEKNKGASGQGSLRDILVFMSDQHTPYYSGFYGDCCVDTPNLTRLCQEGVAFDECYTVNPLCGPARMSLLSGKRPASTGIFHRSTLPDTTPTFLHYLVEQGYETVLVGRMHFLGENQHHGFTKHLGADMTPVTWNYYYTKDTMGKERGVYAQTGAFAGQGAASVAGGGTSPVLEYDRFVIDTALEYMSQPHEKPQFLMVSIYGPHFPYVAPEELYLKYRQRVKLPESFADAVHCELLKSHQVEVEEKMALACQAAYCGMVEHMDGLFGEIREAFEGFCQRRGTRHGIFYFSDHGDQCGDRRIFGKENFYEKSVKIPFLAAGDQIPEGLRVHTPVSILDIGPTILEYTGAAPMYEADGVSVAEALRGGKVLEHPVYSEYMERVDPGFLFGPYDPDVRFSHGFMLRLGDYKYITYQDYESQDALFDVASDPQERKNLAEEKPGLLREMRELARHLAMHRKAMDNFRREDRTEDLLKKYESAKGNPDVSMQWSGCSQAAGQFPKICEKNPAFFGK